MDLAPVHPHAVCCKCSTEGDPAELLVCEGCNELYHLHCRTPPLAAVPDEDFFCSACLSEGPKLPYSRATDIWDDKAVISYLKGTFQFSDLSGDDNISRVKKRAANYDYHPGVGLFKKAVGGEPNKMIPPKGDRTALIAKCHEECGHFGIKRVESLLNRYTWSGLRSDIAEYIAKCLECRKVKGKFATDPTLHSIPVAPKVWHTIGIDIAGPFPVSDNGNKYLILAVDYLSKWFEVQALPDQTARSSALFLQGIINRFGAMAVVRTDEGRHFQGEFTQVLDNNLVDYQVSRAYHPQANGQAERSVRTVVEALRKSVGPDGELEGAWDTKLAGIVRGYNMATQSSTRMSPFYLMHGWQPALPFHTGAPKVPEQTDEAENVDWEDAHFSTADVCARELQLETVSERRVVAAANIVAAQGRQAKAFNKRKGIEAPQEIPHPSTLYKPGCFVLTREVNPNLVLKPGQQAGHRKLQGAIRGPFRYVKQFSARYCTLEDSAGRVWQKAYHDVIAVDPKKLLAEHTIADFPLKTAEAVALEKEWLDESNAAEDSPAGVRARNEDGQTSKLPKFTH